MKSIEVASSTPRQSLAVRRYECDCMNFQDLRSRVQFFKKVKAGYGGNFMNFLVSIPGNALFYYWLPQCDCSLPDKMTTIVDWTKKSSLMRVWSRDKSTWPFILVPKPPRKRLVCLSRLCSGKSEPKICIITMDRIFSRFRIKRTWPVTRSNIFQKSPCWQSKKNRNNVLLKAKKGVVRYRVWGTLKKPLFLTWSAVIIVCCRVGAGIGTKGILYWSGRFMDCALLHLSLFRQMCILRKPLIVRDKKE